jgi:His-Xaa-Ser system protein HxsD
MEEQVILRGNLEINRKEGYVAVSINPKIYPLDVVLSSAYMFTTDHYVLLDGDPAVELIVQLRPKATGVDLEKFGRDFSNELISYANYAVQVIRNQKMREAIISRVLLTAKEDGIADSAPGESPVVKPWVVDDGIAVPWDEKYAKK